MCSEFALIGYKIEAEDRLNGTEIGTRENKDLR